mmetsp:Transcript_10829/g.24786  ORF Transcript_10829/g.24786 Transcript_10829/m.24786 type:complete len:203 (+) Transcript_10829:2086-2694(+)
MPPSSRRTRTAAACPSRIAKHMALAPGCPMYRVDCIGVYTGSTLCSSCLMTSTWPPCVAIMKAVKEPCVAAFTSQRGSSTRRATTDACPSRDAHISAFCLLRLLLSRFIVTACRFSSGQARSAATMSSWPNLLAKISGVAPQHALSASLMSTVLTSTPAMTAADTAAACPCLAASSSNFSPSSDGSSPPSTFGDRARRTGAS